MRPPGPWEMAVILVIILIIFGVGKLPQVGGAIGKGLRAYRKGQKGEDGDEEEEGEGEEEKEEEEPQPRRKKTAAKRPRKTTSKKSGS